MEVIELPVVLLDAATGRRVDEFRTFVRPRAHPVLTDFCRSLTGITQAQVAVTVPLPLPLSLSLSLSLPLPLPLSLSLSCACDRDRACRRRLRALRPSAAGGREGTRPRRREGGESRCGGPLQGPSPFLPGPVRRRLGAPAPA